MQESKEPVTKVVFLVKLAKNLLDVVISHIVTSSPFRTSAESFAVSTTTLPNQVRTDENY